MEITEIKEIGNYYGGLLIKKQKNKHYWCVENYDTDLEGLDDWEEITKELYDALIKFNKQIWKQ